MTVSLQVKEISVTLGQGTVLREVSLELFRGECVVVLGPNGAGKSSLIRSIVRILKPDRGAIILNGTDIQLRTQDMLAREVGYLPQGFDSAFAYTARELVSMGRYAHSQSFHSESAEDREIIAHALDLVGVYPLADRSIDALSSGERQRVLLACCLAQQAPLLLLDEPTTFLDPRHQQEFCELLERLRSELSLTMLWVTHNINLGAAIADRMVALKTGKVCFQGTPQELMQQEVLMHIYDTQFLLVPHPSKTISFIVPQ